jgi:hypothetical protein
MGDILVVFVSGRGALAKLAGVPSVARHVHAGRTLGLDVVVVYPPERRALGAEIRGLVEDDAICVGADQFHESVARPDAGASLLVVAAEWYLSMAAIVAVRDAEAPRVFGRVCERGCVSVPVARIGYDEAAAVCGQLATMSAAASLARLIDAEAASVDLDPRSEQRLSDNVSTAHAEEKLVENLFGPQHVLPVLRLRPNLAPRLARSLSGTVLGPASISAIKLMMGLAAAWIIEGGGLGAFLYFTARVVGSSGAVLARAGFADSGVRERLDLAGDTVLYVAMLWALAGGPAHASGGPLLAMIATTGVLLSTVIAYVFVVSEAWKARAREEALAGGIHAHPGHTASVTTGDEFVSRFVQRDGTAYALLFAAVAGRLDLFLWAAALASHLFYVLWLLTRPRREGGTMAFGRPA